MEGQYRERTDEAKPTQMVPLLCPAQRSCYRGRQAGRKVLVAVAACQGDADYKEFLTPMRLALNRRGNNYWRLHMGQETLITIIAGGDVSSAASESSLETTQNCHVIQ